VQSSRMPAQLIMQVHDELILEVADEAVEAIVEPLRPTWHRRRRWRCPSKSMSVWAATGRSH